MKTTTKTVKDRNAKKKHPGQPGVRGRFASRYDDAALPSLVADVIHFVDVANPLGVSGPRFDQFRAAAGHPHAPSARAITMRLGIGWAAVKEMALRGNAGRGIAVGHLSRRASDRPLPTSEERYFALNYVARTLGVKTLSKIEYARARQRLVTADRTRSINQLRSQGCGLLDELLPEARQFGATAEEWERALAEAGLEPSVVNPERMALSAADAFDLVIELTGKAPQRRTCEELRRHHGISVQRLPSAGEWPDFANAQRVRRGAIGKTTPTDEVSPKDLREIDIPSAVLETLPAKERGRNFWTYELCLRALATYLGEEDKPSQHKYQVASGGRDDLPALGAIQKHGTWSAMLEAARRLRRDGVIPPIEEVQAADAAKRKS